MKSSSGSRGENLFVIPNDIREIQNKISEKMMGEEGEDHQLTKISQEKNNVFVIQPQIQNLLLFDGKYKFDMRFYTVMVN